MPPSHAGLLPALVGWCGGRTDDSLLSALALLRQADRTRKWDRFWQAWRRADPARANRLFNEWQALPPNGRDRLFSAPETAALLDGAAYGNRGHDLTLFEAWLHAERALHGAARACAGWTALGDYRAAVASGHRLADGALLDWRSPAATLKLPEIPGGACPLPPASRTILVPRFDAALLLLTDCGAGWRKAFDGFVATVVVRHDPAARVMSSSSTGLAPGRIVMRNAHLAGIDPPILAEALLHEVVHTLADIAETAMPFANASDNSGLTPSPWTGKPLDGGTFVQACLVWYALFHLWMRLLAQAAVPTERAVKRLSNCAAGFLALHDGAAQFPGHALAPAREAMRDMTADVVAICR